MSSDALLPKLAALAPGPAPAVGRGVGHLPPPPAPLLALCAPEPGVLVGGAAAPRNAPRISEAAAALKGLTSELGCAAAGVRLGDIGAASATSRCMPYGKPGGPRPELVGALLQVWAGDSASSGHG